MTPFEAGNNIIASNTFRDIQAVTYCNVYAENNWWGSAPPNTTKIAALDGSTIDYDPYLFNPPSLSISIAKENMSANDVEKKIVTNDFNVSAAQELSLADDKTTETEISIMISRLNDYWREARKTDLKSFKTYLIGLCDSKEKKTLNAVAKLILAGFEKEKRIGMVEEVIRDYDKQPITETAFMSKFLYYFNEQKDYETAKEVLAEISQKLPQSATLQEVQQHMALIEITGQLKNTNELLNNPTQKQMWTALLLKTIPTHSTQALKSALLLKKAERLA